MVASFCYKDSLQRFYNKRDVSNQLTFSTHSGSMLFCGNLHLRNIDIIDEIIRDIKMKMNNVIILRVYQ